MNPLSRSTPLYYQQLESLLEKEWDHKSLSDDFKESISDFIVKNEKLFNNEKTAKLVLKLAQKAGLIHSNTKEELISAINEIAKIAFAIAPEVPNTNEEKAQEDAASTTEDQTTPEQNTPEHENSSNQKPIPDEPAFDDQILETQADINVDFLAQPLDPKQQEGKWHYLKQLCALFVGITATVGLGVLMYQRFNAVPTGIRGNNTGTKENPTTKIDFGFSKLPKRSSSFIGNTPNDFGFKYIPKIIEKKNPTATTVNNTFQETCKENLIYVNQSQETLKQPPSAPINKFQIAEYSEYNYLKNIIPSRATKIPQPIPTPTLPPISREISQPFQFIPQDNLTKENPNLFCFMNESGQNFEKTNYSPDRFSYYPNTKILQFNPPIQTNNQIKTAQMTSHLAQTIFFSLGIMLTLGMAFTFRASNRQQKQHSQESNHTSDTQIELLPQKNPPVSVWQIMNNGLAFLNKYFEQNTARIRINISDFSGGAGSFKFLKNNQPKAALMPAGSSKPSINCLLTDQPVALKKVPILPRNHEQGLRSIPLSLLIPASPKKTLNPLLSRTTIPLPTKINKRLRPKELPKRMTSNITEEQIQNLKEAALVLMDESNSQNEQDFFGAFDEIFSKKIKRNSFEEGFISHSVISVIEINPDKFNEFIKVCQKSKIEEMPFVALKFLIHRIQPIQIEISKYNDLITSSFIELLKNDAWYAKKLAITCIEKKDDICLSIVSSAFFYFIDSNKFLYAFEFAKECLIRKKAHPSLRNIVDAIHHNLKTEFEQNDLMIKLVNEFQIAIQDSKAADAFNCHQAAHILSIASPTFSRFILNEQYKEAFKFAKSSLIAFAKTKALIAKKDPYGTVQQKDPYEILKETIDQIHQKIHRHSEDIARSFKRGMKNLEAAEKFNSEAAAKAFKKLFDSETEGEESGDIDGLDQLIKDLDTYDKDNFVSFEKLLKSDSSDEDSPKGYVPQEDPQKKFDPAPGIPDLLKSCLNFDLGSSESGSDDETPIKALKTKSDSSEEDSPEESIKQEDPPKKIDPATSNPDLLESCLFDLNSFESESTDENPIESRKVKLDSIYRNHCISEKNLLNLLKTVKVKFRTKKIPINDQAYVSFLNGDSFFNPTEAYTAILLLEKELQSKSLDHLKDFSELNHEHFSELLHAHKQLIFEHYPQNIGAHIGELESLIGKDVCIPIDFKIALTEFFQRQYSEIASEKISDYFLLAKFAKTERRFLITMQKYFVECLMFPINMEALAISSNSSLFASNLSTTQFAAQAKTYYEGFYEQSLCHFYSNFHRWLVSRIRGHIDIELLTNHFNDDMEKGFVAYPELGIQIKSLWKNDNEHLYWKCNVKERRADGSWQEQLYQPPSWKLPVSIKFSPQMICEKIQQYLESSAELKATFQKDVNLFPHELSDEDYAQLLKVCKRIYKDIQAISNTIFTIQTQKANSDEIKKAELLAQKFSEYKDVDSDKKDLTSEKPLPLESTSSEPIPEITTQYQPEPVLLQTEQPIELQKAELPLTVITPSTSPRTLRPMQPLPVIVKASSGIWDKMPGLPQLFSDYPQWIKDKFNLAVQSVIGKKISYKGDPILSSHVDEIFKVASLKDNEAHAKFLTNLRTAIGSQEYKNAIKEIEEETHRAVKQKSEKEAVITPEEAILEICRRRFEEGHYYPFHEKLMHDMGLKHESEGGTERFSKNDFHAIESNPSFIKSKNSWCWEVLGNKARGHLNVDFDPHMQGNIPYIYGINTFGGKERTIIRTGCPTNIGIWGNDQINPEFREYLRYCKIHNIRYLYASLQNEIPQYFFGGDETGRNKALKKLQEEFPENFFVIILTKDSRFYKQLDEYGKPLSAQIYKHSPLDEPQDSSKDFFSDFMEQLKSDQKCFYFPPGWKADPMFVYNIEKLLDVVHVHFFGQKEILDRQEKQDFIVIAEVLIFLFCGWYCDATKLTAACKDNQDRGGEANANANKICLKIQGIFEEKEYRRYHQVNTHAPAMLTKNQLIIESENKMDTSNGRRERLISADKVIDSANIEGMIIPIWVRDPKDPSGTTYVELREDQDDDNSPLIPLIDPKSKVKFRTDMPRNYS